MVGRILRDRVEEQEADEPRQQQREQDPDAPAKREIACSLHDGVVEAGG
jgi:hypothetical protein